MTRRRKQDKRAAPPKSATPPERRPQARNATRALTTPATVISAPPRAAASAGRREVVAAAAPQGAPAKAARPGPAAAARSTTVAHPPTAAPVAGAHPDVPGPHARPAGRPARGPRPGWTAEESFDGLYLRGAGQLFRQVELLTGNAGCARQAVAHAYELAWQRWPEVAQDSDPMGWVRAAAYEYALTPWQRWLPVHRPQTRTPDGPPEAAPARTPDGPLEAALLGLSPAHRTAVMLHDGLGIGLKEAAAEVEATTPAAAARITHARDALAAAVPGLDDDALPGRLGALLDAEPEPPDRPEGVRGASERGMRRRTVGAFALTGVIAALTTVAVALGPIHPGAGGQHGGVGPSPAGERAHAAVRR